MKTFNGKAIYNPSGKAGEYAKWACNFYVGCSNDCFYCYCKKGVLSSAMGGKTATLKKCFRDKEHALKVFEKEVLANLDELRKHGLFFTFTSDPMLPETKEMTFHATGIAVHNHNVPVVVLTKCTDWVDGFIEFMDHSNSDNADHGWRKKIAFGFTLTGHDELEPGASTNAERIEAMKKLHDAGFKTFASIEPIVDFDSSMSMIEQTLGVCDHYKIGLMSGQKIDKDFKIKLDAFVGRACILFNRSNATVYWKDSIIKVYGDILSHASVSRDYNMFKL